MSEAAASPAPPERGTILAALFEAMRRYTATSPGGAYVDSAAVVLPEFALRGFDVFIARKTVSALLLDQAPANLDIEFCRVGERRSFLDKYPSYVLLLEGKG